MTITPLTFVRKSFPIEAIQVTTENMSAVAEWCGGELVQDGSHIKLNIKNPQSERLTRAFSGDWVTRSGRNHKIYEDGPFKRTFQFAPSTLTDEEKREKISHLVLEAMMWKEEAKNRGIDDPNRDEADAVMKSVTSRILGVI